MQVNKSVILFFFLIVLITIGASFFIVKHNAENKLQETLETQHTQIYNEVGNTLKRHLYLPTLLSNDRIIKAFLTTNNKSNDYKKRQEDINLSLEISNNIAGTQHLFLLNPEGIVVATNDWADQNSFLNQDFSSKPYFHQARQNILGRYFSATPSGDQNYYYFASSVQDENEVIGIVVVEIPLSDIASEWTSPIDFIVSDNDGNTFLTSNELLSLQTTNIDLNHEGFQSLTLLDERFEMLSKEMRSANWDIRILTPYASTRREISRNTIISGLLILLTCLLGALILKVQNQRKEFRQTVRENLEKKVKERTAALKKSQEDLIQAAKMAALGELSTGITHEINNPLTAIRAYAENAGLFLKKDRLDMVDSNLKEITKLTETLETITSQLKSFARKSKGELSAVNIDKAIERAISIVHAKIISSGVKISYKKGIESKKQWVLADDVWLSQILVNLLSNAISATKENPENNEARNIWISIDKIKKEKTELYQINIRDNGTGIEKSNLQQIFEPFFTTKPTKKGLGLGLSISFNLAKDMNGTLDARNHEIGGALFRLCIPATNQ